MKVWFRADASTQIGIGHVMRCLTLAEEMQSRGWAVGFICRRHQGHLCDFLEGTKGLPVERLQLPGGDFVTGLGVPEHAHSLGTPWEQDAEETLAFLRSAGAVDWLVVDHYALDARWEGLCRNEVRGLLAVDDLANRPHVCDILLDQNLQLQPNRYSGFVPKECDLLLGPTYALLRSEFQDKQLRARNRRTLRRVLVSFGGADPTGETLKALEALSCEDLCRLEVTVIAGAANPRLEEIRVAAARLPNVRLHRQVDNMAEFMVRADVSVGAAGTATWERCCVGLPAVVIAVAENQVPIAQATQAAGACVYLGRAESVSVTSIRETLRELIARPEALQQMEVAGRTLVDGLGAQRVGDRLAGNAQKAKAWA